MKSFYEFLSENLIRLNFPILRNFQNLSDPSHIKMKANYLEALDIFQRASDVGSISKKDYDFCKSSFQLFFEKTSDFIFYNTKSPLFKVLLDFRKDHNLEFSDKFEFRKSKSAVDFASKAKSVCPEYFSYVDAGNKLFQEFTIFKSKIELKAKKASTEVTTTTGSKIHIKKMASGEAINKINKILTAAFSEIRKNLVGVLKKQNDDNFKKLEQLVEEKNITSLREAVKQKISKQSLYYYKMCYSVDGAKQNFDMVSTKKAEADARALEEFFIAKNLSKLAVIFERKTELKTHKVLSNKVNPNGVLENRMFFEFDDGSSFKIYTTVEYVYDTSTPFIRMPTRFSDVVLANGSLMKQPSEEKMDKEF